MMYVFIVFFAAYFVHFTLAMEYDNTNNQNEYYARNAQLAALERAIKDPTSNVKTIELLLQDLMPLQKYEYHSLLETAQETLSEQEQAMEITNLPNEHTARNLGRRIHKHTINEKLLENAEKIYALIKDCNEHIQNNQ